LSAAATNGWVLLVGILPIGAAVNLAVYWYNQHPTTRDFQTSEAMVIFVLSLIALFVFWLLQL